MKFPWLRDCLLAFAVFAALGGWMHREVLGDAAHKSHLHTGDPRLNRTILAWGAHQLTHDDERGLWDLPMFAPRENMLAHSEHLLGNQVLFLPLQWLTGSDQSAYVYWMLLCHALDFLIPVIVLRRRGSSLATAFFVGASFAFFHQRLAQAAHAQLYPQFWSVLALDALWQFLTDGRKRSLVFAAVFAAMQFWFGMFLGFDLLVGAAFVFLGWLVWERKWERFSKAWKAWVLALPVGAVLISPLLWHYLPVSRELGAYSVEEAWRAAPTPLQFLWGWQHGWLAELGVFEFARPERWEVERVLFLGSCSLLLFPLGLFSLRSTNCPERVHTTAALLLVVLVIWQPFYAVVHALIPGLESVRTPGRFILLFPWLWGWAHRRWLDAHPRMTWVFVAVVALETIGTIPAAPVPAQDPELHAAIAERTPPRAQLLHLPISIIPGNPRDPVTPLDYMDGWGRHWRGMANGYTGRIPPEEEAWRPWSLAASDDFPAFFAQCRQAGVTHVVIHFRRMKAAEEWSWSPQSRASRAAWAQRIRRWREWVQSHPRHVVAVAPSYWAVLRVPRA